MPESKIRTTGLLPFSFKGRDKWSGDTSVAPGKCLLEWAGCSQELTKDRKKIVRMHHKIIQGPVDGADELQGTNAGRTIWRDFHVYSEKALNFLHYYADALAGDAAFVGDERQLELGNLRGIKFWCEIYLRPYEGDDGTQKKAGELRLRSIEPVEGSGATPTVSTGSGESKSSGDAAQPPADDGW